MSTRILFFETENDFAHAVRDRLTSSGVEVEIVDDASIGLASAEARPPSLILLTVELGRTNGFLVCKRIKKTSALSEIPIVILSAADDAEATFEQHRGLRYRADLYLKKPIDVDALAEEISALVPLVKPSQAVRDDATQLFSRDEIDAEIDAFAEDAFDSLFLDESPSEPASLSQAADELIVEELDLGDALILDEELDGALFEEPVGAQQRSVPPPAPSAPPPAPPEALTAPGGRGEVLGSSELEPLGEILRDDDAFPAAWATEKDAAFIASEAEVRGVAEIQIGEEQAGEPSGRSEATASAAPVAAEVFAESDVAEERDAEAASEAKDLAGDAQMPLQSEAHADIRQKGIEAELESARLAEAEAQAELAEQRARAEAARAEADALQEEVRGLKLDLTDLENLKRRLAELEKAASGANASSREILDLREQLNKKDKESLDLRDQITERDKQLIALREQNLAAARERADLDEKLVHGERELGTLRERLARLESDREAAAKRDQEYKGRIAKLEEKGRTLEDQLEAVKRAAAEQKASSEEAIGAARDEHERTIAALKAGYEESLTRLRTESEEAATMLREEQDAALKTKEAAHEEILAELKQAAEADKASALARLREEFSAARAELEAAHLEALSEASAKLETREAELKAEIAAAMSAQASERASSEAAIAEKDAANAELRATLEQSENALSAARAEIERLQGEFESERARRARAEQKIADDGELLSRVHKAMVVGLGLLEEQKRGEFAADGD